VALIPQCDRCGAVGCQVVPVLGVECCAQCLEEVRNYLATPPAQRGETARASRIARILRTAAARGYVDAQEFAAASGEAYRTAYYSMMGIARSGRLKHQGRGRFVLVT
jgi:hypothetical protein